jgi:hypothetical protein
MKRIRTTGFKECTYLGEGGGGGVGGGVGGQAECVFKKARKCTCVNETVHREKCSSLETGENDNICSSECDTVDIAQLLNSEWNWVDEDNSAHNILQLVLEQCEIIPKTETDLEAVAGECNDKSLDCKEKECSGLLTLEETGIVCKNAITCIRNNEIVDCIGNVEKEVNLLALTVDKRRSFKWNSDLRYRTLIRNSAVQALPFTCEDKDRRDVLAALESELINFRIV